MCRPPFYITHHSIHWGNPPPAYWPSSFRFSLLLQTLPCPFIQWGFLGPDRSISPLSLG